MSSGGTGAKVGEGSFNEVIRTLKAVVGCLISLRAARERNWKRHVSLGKKSWFSSMSVNYSQCRARWRRQSSNEVRWSNRWSDTKRWLLKLQSKLLFPDLIWARENEKFKRRLRELDKSVSLKEGEVNKSESRLATLEVRIGQLNCEKLE